MSDILEIYRTAPNGSELIKAIREEKAKGAQPPKSAIIDPMDTMGMFGLRSKPTAIPYAVLRRMAQIPAISAIINTRLNQVARFAKRPRFDGDLGFKIVLKDRQKKMTEAERKVAMEIENFFLKTGAVRNARRKDNLNQFIRKLTRDTLVLDAMTVEKVPNLKGGLAEIWAVDSATIELVANAPTGESVTLPVYIPQTKSGLKIQGDIAYVQKVNGLVVAEYTEEELAYAVRNPRTDLDFTDFGYSELETLIEIVTGIMNGIRYNTSYFSHSNLPQGVLEIVGKYKDDHLEAFKRHWKSLTSGASGKWSVPVMGLEEGQGFKFTPFKTSNRDMEFNEFLEFLFNIACAVYQIDPNEVGFKSWTSSNSMSASDNTSEKIDNSKDKGFIPLMNFLSDTFNSEIVDEINEEFEFTWVGVDEEDEDRKLERLKGKLEAGIVTVAEVRKAEDMEEILDEEGKPAPWTTAPANAQLIQVFMNGIQQAQAEDQQAQQQEQGELDHNRAKETSDDAHQKQLEVMDKQHQQNLEAKKVDQEHQNKMEQFKAKNQKPAPLKKSLIDDTEDSIEISIDWKDY